MTASAGIAALGAPTAFAQTWPAAPVRLVVGFAHGGSAEQYAQFTRDEIAKWTKVAKEAKVTLDS